MFPHILLVWPQITNNEKFSHTLVREERERESERERERQRIYRGGIGIFFVG